MLFYIFVIVTVASYIYLNQKYEYWKKRGVPHPKPKFFFGNTAKAVLNTKMLSKIVHETYNNYKDHSWVGLYNFWSPAIVVRDVELIKDVLIKRFNNFHDNWIEVAYEVDPVMAKNPFVMQGNEWKVVRTQLTPQYTGAKLKQMIPLMEACAKKMTKYVEDKSASKKSNTFEAKELIGRFTGENVLSCAYGLEGKSFEDDVPVSFKIGEEIASSDLIVQIKQTIGLFFPQLRRLFKVTFLGCPIPKVFWDMILSTVKYRDENNIVRKDYIDFIRDLRKPGASPYEVDDPYTVAHAFTYFLDSFETSSISFTYTLYELASNPDVQERAREEIDRVFEKHQGKLSHEAILELEYLDNVLSESLRMNPILNFFSRVCTEECSFPSPTGSGPNMVIEKGTQIFLPIYSVHHDPNYYPDPDRFDPDRFTEEVKSTRPKGTFMGFGDGPRICLGKNYALQQIKVALAHLLREFELKLNSKTKIPMRKEKLQVLNVPGSDVLIDFHKRS